MPDTNEQILDPGVLPEALEIDDWDILADFYVMFLQQLYPLLSSLELNRGAMSREELQHTAHRMSSSCRTVGAQPLASVFETLENLCRNKAFSGEEKPVLEYILTLGNETTKAVEALMQQRNQPTTDQ